MTSIERRARLDGVAVALMLTCCVLWGVQQVLVKATLPVLPPFLQASVRSLVAALLVGVWAVGRGIPLFERDRTLVPGLAAGVLFGLEFLCIYGALPLTDASRVSVFIYLAPFVVALLLPRFVPAERLSPLQMLGLIAAFAAMASAFAEGFGSSKPMQWVGDGLAIFGAVLWGATTLIIRASRLTSTAPEKTLLYQLSTSAVILYGASLATHETWPSHGMPLWGWASIAFQSVVIAFASYLTWFWLLRRYPATRLSAFSFLTPIFGIAFAAIALGESITFRLLVAMVFVAVGIALVNGKPGRRAVADPATAREAP